MSAGADGSEHRRSSTLDWDIAECACCEKVARGDAGFVVCAHRSIRTWTPDDDGDDAGAIAWNDRSDRFALKLEQVALVVDVGRAHVLLVIEHQGRVRRQLPTHNHFGCSFVKRLCIELHDEPV